MPLSLIDIAAAFFADYAADDFLLSCFIFSCYAATLITPLPPLRYAGFRHAISLADIYVYAITHAFDIYFRLPPL